MITSKKNISSFESPPLVIFGGGIHQIPYIEYCIKNELPTLVIDKNQNCPAKEYCDYLLSIETPNDESLSVFNAIYKITFKSGVLGVLVAGVELAILGSFIAKKFKTKSIKVSTAKTATNKINRAIQFKKFGIPYAKFEVVEDLFLVNKNYPYVIKTEEGSGSRGVRVISSEYDFISAQKELSKKNNSKFLVEEFLKGDEISIEAFIYEGKFNYYCFAIRDIQLISNGQLIEHGSIADPRYDNKKIEQVKKVFEDACQAIGLQEGPAKGDILITALGPRVIEIASRSAPLAPLISKEIYGFDMISTHIRWAMGFRIIFSPKLVDISKSKPVCHRYLSHKKGIINNIIGIDSAIKSKDVIKIVILRKLIYPFKLEDPTNTNRILYVVTTGSDANNARLNADISLSKIKLSYNQML